VANNLGLTEPMFTHNGQNIVKQANHSKANSFTKQKVPSQAGCCRLEENGLPNTHKGHWNRRVFAGTLQKAVGALGLHFGIESTNSQK